MDCKPEQGQLGSSSKAGGRKAAPRPTEGGNTAKGSSAKRVLYKGQTSELGRAAPELRARATQTGDQPTSDAGC